MSKPLEGVKVIELATFIAAATAGRFMADLGADVIKIESAKGDPLRYTAPSEGRPLDMYENTTWDLENGNKRCISLNMKTPEGKEAFFKLLDSADVLITNWRVQALQRAGLDYESLKERYPKLVYAICTGFGDHNVGMNLVAGILAALYQAKTKGVGEKVETSLFESAVYNMGMMVQASSYEGIAQHYPINIRNGANPFNSAWHTADDRYIQTCMPDYNTYYKKFIAAVGREDLVENENYFPILTCQEKGLTTEVYDIVMEAFEKKTAAEWREILTAADIPFALCQNWIEIRNDKQAEANHCFYDMTYSNGNTRRLVRTPVKFENMGVPDYRRGPLIGEQGVDVLKEIGYNDEQIDALKANGTLYIWEDPKKA